MLKLNPGYSGKGNIGQGMFACIFGAYGDVCSGLSARRWQRGPACRGIPDGMITGRDGSISCPPGELDRCSGSSAPDFRAPIRIMLRFPIRAAMAMARAIGTAVITAMQERMRGLPKRSTGAYPFPPRNSMTRMAGGLSIAWVAPTLARVRKRKGVWRGCTRAE